MKTYSVKKVMDMNDYARSDLMICKNIMAGLNQKDPKYSKREFMFMQSIARCEEEDFKNGSFIQKWKLVLQKKIDHIEQLLVGNEKWIAERLGKPHRCTLPKKKQRELGMLPPI